MSRTGGPRTRPLTRSEIKAKEKAYILANKEKRNAKSLEWYRENVDRQAYSSKKKNYLKNYGITPEEVIQILKDQNDKCAICKKEIPLGGHTGGHVDHCHITNINRGILCQKCNVGIGMFGDDINMLRDAINYLKKYRYPRSIEPIEEAG